MINIKQLRAENKQLRQMVRLDALTGLLNRSVFEEEVKLALKESTAEGTLMMIDLDDFKGVNDQYGHFVGDLVLQALARILSNYFFPKDLVARMGGDEFAVFLRGKYPHDMLEHKISSAMDRFMQSGKDIGISKKLSFTVGVATVVAGQTFSYVYQCADNALLRGKRKSPGCISYYSPKQTDPPRINTKEKSAPAFSTDVQHIRRQLRESEPQKGAYCPDYQNFMTVYHFLERSLCRTPQSIPLILISLIDASGDFPPPEERMCLTRILADDIQVSLRTSDIFTQYSSAQFLVMAPGADEDNIILIQDRIIQAVTESLANRNDLSLHFSFYPLRPIFKQDVVSPT